MLADPGATPVTTPPFVTVAVEVLLLVHVPPLEGVRFKLAPTQTSPELGTVTLGVGSTEIEPPKFTVPHDPPLVVTVYLKFPVAVGVPDIV